MGSLPIASRQIKCHWALSKVSTTRSACSSAGLTGYVMRNTSDSKYSAACSRKSNKLSLLAKAGQRRDGPATIRQTSHGGPNSPRAYACQVQRRRRRWPERPDFTGIGSRGANGGGDDVQINQSTLVPVLASPIGGRTRPVSELHPTAITCQPRC